MPLSDEVRLHPGSYVDPGGRLYESNDVMLRGIHKQFAAFYINTLRNPVVCPMIGRQIIGTEIEPDGLPDYELTLRHPKIKPVSFAYEWPAIMLRDAALLTLDIGVQLADAGLTLQDASPWNIVFDGPHAVFVDFTSIVPEDPHLLWVAYDQFCRLFLYPLALWGINQGRVTRSLLTDAINGISETEVASLLPLQALFRMPWLVNRLYLPRLVLAVIRRLRAELKIGQYAQRLSPVVSARQTFLESLRKDVLSVPLSNRRSRWSGYYEDYQSFFHPSGFNLKQVTVARLLDELRPKTVVDIGCNQGGYSILAACMGARVVAFDSDEDSVGLLYETAVKESLHILPIVMNVLNPSPACGWRTLEFLSAPQRFRSDMALALALVHHLAITQHQTFERIVLALADYADKWLLTEFVPLEDPRSQELLVSHQRDMSWYALDGFTQALRREFGQVEAFPSFPDGRVLILCTR